MEQQLKTDIDPQKVNDLLETHDLYWNVKKEQLYTGDGIRSPYYGMVRADTEHFLGVAKGSYEVFQNWESAELVVRVAEELGSDVSNGGYFSQGKQIFLQIKIGDESVGGDAVKRFASVINSFDGSTCLRWGGTNVVVVCQNTFWAAYAEMENCVRHTKNMRVAVGESLKIIEKINEYDTSLFELFNKMAETGLSEKNVKDVIFIATGVDPKKTVAEAKQDYSTRKLNIAAQLNASIVQETKDRETLWGLWNGLTHFTTHKAGTDKSRERNKALGNLQRMDNEVFDYMVELINA